MFVNYPYEWRKYLLKDKVRTFSKDTPKEIIEEAKKINEASLELEEKLYFHFEGEE